MSLPILVQLFRAWMYAGKRIYVYAIGILDSGFGCMRDQHALHITFDNLFLFELAMNSHSCRESEKQTELQFLKHPLHTIRFTISFCSNDVVLKFYFKSCVRCACYL